MLKLTSHKNSPNLYIRGTVDRRYVYESTGTSIRKLAKDRLKKREDEIRDRIKLGKEITFQDAYWLYLKSGGENRFFKPLIKYFKNVKIGNITQALVDDAAITLYPFAKNSTINRQVYTPVSSVINNAALSKYCHRVRFKRPKIVYEERPHATPEYLSRFMDYAPDNLAAICLFMAKTGVRIGNAVDLTWDDVNLQKHRAVMMTKNGDIHHVYLPTEVVVLLSNMKKGEKVFGYACRSSLYGVMKNTAKKAGLPYLTPHEIGRHTFATWYMEFVEPNLKKLMEAGGWKSIQSVIKYVHVVPSEAKTAVEKFPEIREKSVESNAK